MTGPRSEDQNGGAGPGVPRALAFSCSPRGGRGATELLLSAFLEGFREGGGTADVLRPYSMKLEPCRGCFSCWTRTPGRCGISDDMSGVLEKLQGADVLLFATPVYHFTMSEGMKRLIERTMPLLDPMVLRGEDGRTRHGRLGRKDQRAVLLATCGFPERGVFEPLRLTFREICRMMDWDMALEVLRTEAGLLLAPGCRDGAASYLRSVRKAGAGLARGERPGRVLASELGGELVPRDEYYGTVNRWFERARGARRTGRRTGQ